MTHLDELQLEELLLGTAGEAARAAALSHAEGCARCAGALRGAREAWAAVGQGVPEAPPSPALRVRLLDAVAAPGLLPFADLLARCFDLTPDQAVALLRAADDAGPWAPGPGPGFEARAFPAGPRRRGGVASLLRGAPGAALPRHGHGSPELTVVLRGGLTTDAGQERWPGSTLAAVQGERHGFRCGPGGCLAAVLVLKPGEPAGAGPDGSA